MFPAYHVRQTIELWQRVVWETRTDISYWSNAEAQLSLEQLKAFLRLEAGWKWSYIQLVRTEEDGLAYAISLYIGFVSGCAVMGCAIPLWVTSTHTHTHTVTLFIKLAIHPTKSADTMSGHALHLKHSYHPTGFIFQWSSSVCVVRCVGCHAYWHMAQFC